MKKYLLLLILLSSSLLMSCASNPQLAGVATEILRQTAGGGALTQAEIGRGLKEALRVGTDSVVGQLGAVDGFNADPRIHIPLPDNLLQAKKIAGQLGLASAFDDLELKMNRAAEAAAPKAKALFWDAIQQLTIEDIMAIYKGNDDAATRYFESKMSTPLVNSMLPVVQQSMAEVGAVRSYDQLVRSMGPAGALLPDYKTQLTNHVLQLGTGAIFNYLAEEEAAIRQDPVKRTTQLLQRVFGAVY